MPVRKRKAEDELSLNHTAAKSRRRCDKMNEDQLLVHRQRTRFNTTVSRRVKALKSTDEYQAANKGQQQLLEKEVREKLEQEL